MRLLHRYMLWIFVLAIELCILYKNVLTGRESSREFIYILIAVTVVVGITSLFLLKSTNEKLEAPKKKVIRVNPDRII